MCTARHKRRKLPLRSESYLIQSRDPGVQLYVRNKRPQYMTAFSPEKTLLYVHGSTQASETTFEIGKLPDSITRSGSPTLRQKQTPSVHDRVQSREDAALCARLDTSVGNYL